MEIILLSLMAAFGFYWAKDTVKTVVKNHDTLQERAEILLTLIVIDVILVSILMIFGMENLLVPVLIFKYATLAGINFKKTLGQ